MMNTAILRFWAQSIWSRFIAQTLQILTGISCLWVSRRQDTASQRCPSFVLFYLQRGYLPSWARICNLPTFIERIEIRYRPDQIEVLRPIP